MAGINVGRVILGGLAAGVVANAGDYVINTVLLTEDMSQMATRLGLDQSALDSSMVTWIVVDFLYGLLIAFTYAAIRPRFGPGPATACLAGLLLFLAITVVLVGFMSMGIFTQDAFMRSAGLSLVVTLAASLVAGAIYKE
jgi:hypothetical protein